MDSRSKYLELYAIKASYSQTAPLAAAAHYRALSILLSTDVFNPHLSSADRRDARALSRIYKTRYDDECLWSSQLSRPLLSNTLSAATKVDGGAPILETESGIQSTTNTSITTEEHYKEVVPSTRRGISYSSIPLGTDPLPGVLDHVQQRVDKALERKKLRKGFEPSVPQVDWAAHRLDLNELLNLRCGIDMDLLPEPEAIEALVERAAKLQIAVQEASLSLAARTVASPATTAVQSPAATTPGLTDAAGSELSPIDPSEETSGSNIAIADDMLMKQITTTHTNGSTGRSHRHGKSSVSGKAANESTMAAVATTTTRSSSKASNAAHNASNTNNSNHVVPKYTMQTEDGDHWPARSHDARPQLPFTSNTFSNGLDSAKSKKRLRTDDGNDLRHADEKPYSTFVTAKERLVNEEKDGNKRKYDDYTHGGSRSHLYNNNDHNDYGSSGGNAFSNGSSNTFGAVSGILKSKVAGTKHKKFRPPLNRSNSGDQESYGTSGTLGKKGSSITNGSGDDIMDERLKNIEPKMIEAIKNEIMDTSPTITWDDIAGLDHAKDTIKEAVIWPMLRPELFGGLRTPPKGLLLFGPPGTGKTMIGKCIASQSKATFFNISSSSLTSKWVGDGEKMVRALFAVARCHQPAVIFIDEIDSLLTQRTDGEFEASRRIKTEFLVQFDGVGTAQFGDKDRILCIGATNRPQELDEAARRRFMKRLYIPLPDANGRYSMIKTLLKNQLHDLTEENIQEIQQLTEGYSGSDINGLCREAAFGPIRSIRGNILEIDENALRPINYQDFKDALSQVRASVSDRDLDMYMKWETEYGSLGTSKSGKQ